MVRNVRGQRGLVHGRRRGCETSVAEQRKVIFHPFARPSLSPRAQTHTLTYTHTLVCLMVCVKACACVCVYFLPLIAKRPKPSLRNGVKRVCARMSREGGGRMRVQSKKNTFLSSLYTARQLGKRVKDENICKSPAILLSFCPSTI